MQSPSSSSLRAAALLVAAVIPTISLAASGDLLNGQSIYGQPGAVSGASRASSTWHRPRVERRLRRNRRFPRRCRPAIRMDFQRSGSPWSNSQRLLRRVSPRSRPSPHRARSGQPPTSDPAAHLRQPDRLRA